ncbi:2TM domain-containing protein [Tenacibaculum sp. IB213877]|uniref:2TM domain-containing protein n=1 Tax=Tenacibaculum sp. IB213877 TaxID=3097351 RepID=UPI002A5ACBC9|nr:2TM domain-containing protein [Tenacibaculum sp. IB213877]MDY0779229.1 2TM domain-containing protein [Tenacibaculum sp. IB213877]
MERDYTQEERYILAKRHVKKVKGFYAHLFWYLVINIFISAVVIYGIMSNSKSSFIEALTHFGTYSTWIFWGIGLFFHWLGVYGYPHLLTKNWEERKIKELMEQEEERKNRMLKK